MMSQYGTVYYVFAYLAHSFILDTTTNRQTTLDICTAKTWLEYYHYRSWVLRTETYKVFAPFQHADPS